MWINAWEDVNTEKMQQYLNKIGESYQQFFPILWKKAKNNRGFSLDTHRELVYNLT